MYKLKKNPRVLVISHIVFSETFATGRTLKGFFKNWDKSSIAQLYFHSEIPTTDISEKYYRITDFDIIRGLFKSSQIGTVFTDRDVRFGLISPRVDSGFQSEIYQLGKKRKPFMYIGRNLLWNTQKWKGDSLEKWIDSFNPEVVYFATGDFSFAYHIALYIAKSRRIPLVSYICDDYYFSDNYSMSPLHFIARQQFKKTFERFIKHSANNIYICDMIREKYSTHFGSKGETIMTSSELPLFEMKPVNKIPIVSYLGNLGNDRWKPLLDISRILKRISPTLKLDVYSQELRQEVLQHLTDENGIDFHGAVPYAQVKKIMQISDILIHTEDFSKNNVTKTRYSISTKIADALSCGTCLFAYGPGNIASIDYLKKNEAACVVSSRSQIEKTLTHLIRDSSLRNMYIKRGLCIAREQHNIDRNSSKFKSVINNVLDNFKQ